MKLSNFVAFVMGILLFALILRVKPVETVEWLIPNSTLTIEEKQNDDKTTADNIITPDASTQETPSFGNVTPAQPFEQEVVSPEQVGEPTGITPSGMFLDSTTLVIKFPTVKELVCMDHLYGDGDCFWRDYKTYESELNKRINSGKYTTEKAHAETDGALPFGRLLRNVEIGEISNYEIEGNQLLVYFKEARSEPVIVNPHDWWNEVEIPVL